MTMIYFVGTYKPIMCGIADYTSFITGNSPAGSWGVLSFDIEKSGAQLISSDVENWDRVWYGIPGWYEFSAPVIEEGLKQLGARKEDPVLWFQHEFGIWPNSIQFVDILRNLKIPRVVTFHTLHFQSTETRSGLRREQHDFLQILLPVVDAITVFSWGVYDAVTSAFPEYSRKVHVIKHGIHSYPAINRLSRSEAKDRFNDFLLYESDLDREMKEKIHREGIFSNPGNVVLGGTGFLCPSKQSELLFQVSDRLQKVAPGKNIIAVRVGNPRDETQRIYADKLRATHNSRGKYFFETWLPEGVLPLAQYAFDINFFWPRDCTQSGVLSHALGAGAVVAGRDLEGVGETLKEAGGLAETDLRKLINGMKELLLNPELAARIEEKALCYAGRFSWEIQARRHFELAEELLSQVPVASTA
ncbi:MAG: hypothetical protein JSW16_00945 [Dehalococcoidales bacterium]|nr:MAG: hypothetical protein JSW16_00945 [Dehalococcoidales bacterium]